MCITCNIMTKRTSKQKTMQYTARIHRQHSSLVVTVPKGLCNQLQIVKGDMLLFEVEPGDVAAVVGKLKLRGSECGPDKGNTNSADKCGGT